MVKKPCCEICTRGNGSKGLWSGQEDDLLKKYMKENDNEHVTWTSLPIKAGIKRCSKSCRQRWLNYLRPNINHGKLSEDEVRLIQNSVERFGTKWSIIAGALPGRTDNDLKNFWNCKNKHLKIASEIKKSPVDNELAESSNYYSSALVLEADLSKLPLLGDYSTSVPTKNDSVWNVPGTSSDVFNTYHSINNIPNNVENSSDLLLNIDHMRNIHNIPKMLEISSLVDTLQDFPISVNSSMQQQIGYDPNVTENNFDMHTMFGDNGDQISFGFSEGSEWSQILYDFNKEEDDGWQIQPNYASFDTICNGGLIQDYNKNVLGRLGPSNGEVINTDEGLFDLSGICGTAASEIDIGGGGFGSMNNTDSDLNLVDAYGGSFAVDDQTSMTNTSEPCWEFSAMSTNGSGAFGNLYAAASAMPTFDQNAELNYPLGYNFSSTNNIEKVLDATRSNISSNTANNFSYLEMNDQNGFYY